MTTVELQYDIEFSFVDMENDHLQMGATTITVDHEITTSDDIKTVVAEIGRQNGYRSCKLESIIPHLEQEVALEAIPEGFLDDDDV